MTRRTEEDGVNIGPSKSNLIAFTKKDAFLHNLEVKRYKCVRVKYLEVILDPRLTWNRNDVRIKRNEF